MTSTVFYLFDNIELLKPIIFLVILFFILVFAISIGLTSNPLYASLLLVSLFILLGFLFILLGFQFFAFIFIIVYAGAIAVLFLFVVMMFNFQRNYLAPKTERFFDSFTLRSIVKLLSYIPISIVVFKFIVYFFHSQRMVVFIDKITFPIIKSYSHGGLDVLSAFLYTNYSYVLIFSGLILFVGMIGSLLIIQDIKKTYIKEHEYKQINKSLKKTIYLYKKK